MHHRDQIRVVNTLPSEGFLREKQIVGDPKKGLPAIIPISRAAWRNGIEAGIYPRPVHLSERVIAWRAKDIIALVERLNSGGEK